MLLQKMVAEQIGRRIQLAREAAGCTRADWYEKFGVKVNKLCQWELGKHLADFYFILTMCKQYNLSLDWLLLGAGDDPLSALKAAYLPASPEILAASSAEEPLEHETAPT